MIQKPLYMEAFLIVLLTLSPTFNGDSAKNIVIREDCFLTFASDAYERTRLWPA